jgi:hypothetical protein
MLGFVAAVISYALTGQIIYGVFWWVAVRKVTRVAAVRKSSIAKSANTASVLAD